MTTITTAADVLHDEAATTWAKATLERSGLTVEALLNTLALNEHGHKINLRNDLGEITMTSTRADDLTGIKRHVEFALSKTASRRWLPAMRRNQQRRLRDLLEAMQAEADALGSSLGLRVAQCWRAWAVLIETELATLKRRQAEAQAMLTRTEDPLRAVQAEIEAVLHPKQDGVFGRLKDALVSMLSQGVNVITQVMNASRLVNDREEYAFALDAQAAATTLLQEAAGFAQQQLDAVTQLHNCAQAALMQVEQRMAQVQASLRANPYARVDVTSAEQALHLGDGLPMQAADHALSAYAAHDPAGLLAMFYDTTQQRVGQLMRGLSLVQLAELQAQPDNDPQTGDSMTDGLITDLAMDALTLANQQAALPTLALRDDASPTTRWLAGVADATTSEFNFGAGCIMVSTQRMDQVQVLRVTTGLALRDLQDYAALEPAFEAALSERNYYADAAMADYARAQGQSEAAFALGLACGWVQVQRGHFVAQIGAGSTALGATPQQALATLAAEHPVAEAMLAQVNELSPRELAERLQAYLAQPRDASDASDTNGALWLMCATQVRERLALAHEQMRFVGEGE